MFSKKINHFSIPANAHNKKRNVMASLPFAITLAIFLFPQTAYSASSNTQNSQTSADNTNMSSNSVELKTLTEQQRTTLDAIAKDKELPVEVLYKLFKAIKHQLPNESDSDLFELMSEAIDEMEIEELEAEIAEAIEEIEAEITEAIEEIEEEMTEAMEEIEAEVTEAIDEMEAEITEEIDAAIDEANQ